MRYLAEVNLSSNNLTSIVNASFVNLAALTTLNLSHNAIRYVAVRAFDNVDVRYNNTIVYQSINQSIVVYYRHDKLFVVSFLFFLV